MHMPTIHYKSASVSIVVYCKASVLDKPVSTSPTVKAIPTHLAINSVQAYLI